MASYICPCCGSRFNGKKCRNCYYETFDDEISRSLHTHQEVNVPDRSKPTERPKAFKIPATRPPQVQKEWEQQKREFRRRQQQKRTRKGLPKWLVWILVFTLLEPVLAITGEVIEAIGDGISFGTREPAPQAPEPDAVLPETAKQVFASDGFTVYLNGTDSDLTYELYVENATDQDVRLSARRVIVDGFLSENSGAWCDVPAGTRRVGELQLDMEDMAWAVMGDPSRIDVAFAIYDTEDYEDILEGSFTIDNGLTPQPVSPVGDILVDGDEIQVGYLGYEADTYYPEEFYEGILRFYLENRTEYTMSIYAEEVLLNGQETDLSLWSQLPGNTRTVTRMWLYSAEDAGIETLSQVETMELHLVAYSEEAGNLDLGWITLDVA